MGNSKVNSPIQQEITTKPVILRVPQGLPSVDAEDDKVLVSMTLAKDEKPALARLTAVKWLETRSSA